MSKTRSGFLLLLLLAALCLSVVSASGECAHSSTREEAVITPTCTEPGIMGLFCTVCGEQIIDYAVPIDPLGHDYQIVTLQVHTCTQPEVAYEECSRCGQRGNTITKGATGHIPGRPERKNEVPATCTQEGGYDEVVRCSVCGTELERTHVSTGEGYHSMGFPYIVDEPTCRHEGLAAQDCRNCGYTESWTLEKTGHTWPDQGVNEKQVYPTCDEIGTYDYVYYCTVCGVELKREECTWRALGHNWGAWETVREPTFDEEGLERRVCERNSSHVQEQKLDVQFQAPDYIYMEPDAAGNTPMEPDIYMHYDAAGNMPMEPETNSNTPFQIPHQSSEENYFMSCGESLARDASSIRSHEFKTMTFRAPTYTQPGEIVDVCSRCGFRRTVTFPPRTPIN